MISINGKQLRNLEEQVLKNKEDIAAHYNMDRVLADFGIRIIGTIPSAADLPMPFNGQYGDAFAVGDKAPYDFYIWTRADVNAGHADDYWFFLGSLAIVGPKGDKGDTGAPGATGERGSIWMSAPRNPDTITGYRLGDQWLNTVNGYVYAVKEINGALAWSNTGNIRGPQGPQGLTGQRGEKGETGETGPRGAKGEGAEIVKIVGTITDADQLPNPEETLPTTAYLQEVEGIWDLWVITGQPGSYQWLNTGPLTAGSLITRDGDPVVNWNIDNVLEGPFEDHDILNYGNKNVSGLLTQSTANGITARYYVTVPKNEIEDAGILGTLSKSIAEFDTFGRIGALAKNKLDYMRLKNVPKEGNLQNLAAANLPDHMATPRAYVDSQIEFAGQDKVSWPTEIPQTGMLLGINPDKSVEAIDPATIEGHPIKVDCQIVKRGGSLVLPRDRMYLIRGYGENTCTLKNNQGTKIAENFTMAFGAVSSSNVEISDPTKTWAGFMYISNTSSYIPSINWNGNSHQEVIVYNNDTGTSGSGNLYVYSIGN